MAGLADFVLRHRLPVLVFWLVVLLAGGYAASGISHRLSKDFAVPGAASYRTNQQILRTYGNGGGGNPDIVVISLSRDTTVYGRTSAAPLRSAFAALARKPHLRVLSYFNSHDRRFIADGGRTTFALVYKPFHGELATNNAAATIAHTLDLRLPAGARVRITGIDELASGGSGNRGFGVLAETLVAGIAALAVLVFVFGSPLALLPLALAAVAILATFLLIAALTQLTQVSLIVEYLVALIGLGVAIDYSLLIVTRWREELAAGCSSEEAVRRAVVTAGRAVAFSAIIVAIGLLALVILPVPALRSIGFGGMLVPLVSALVALTLLPVLLATLGVRIDRLRLRRRIHSGNGWARWARSVVAHRWLAACAATALLALLAAVALQLKVGEPSSGSLAQTGSAAEALHQIEQAHVPSGILTPIEALTSRGVDPHAAAARLARISGIELAAAPPGPGWRRNDTSLITLIPTHELTTAAGAATLARVRAVVVRTRGVEIGGAGALTIDETHVFYRRFPLVLALIALTSLLLLARAFRSLLLPLKAIVLNLASVAATYGLLVLVWQQGHGSNAIWGVPATGAITNWVPLMAFAFLYGLSMDYEVFILSRIREEYDRTGSTDQAIVTGIGRTGRLVTSAALILFLAFAALSTGPETDLKIMATALGMGILLDATIVRALLVPALVSLFGRWNWWLPQLSRTALGRAQA
jgi:putative drug exporter of the RND superfamily